MPVLKYFLTMGPALTLGLFLLSAYLGPAAPDSAAKVSKTVTTASIMKLEPRRAGN
jgi:hypothetical protein